MSGFSFSKLKQAKPSMRRRLFLYMGALAAGNAVRRPSSVGTAEKSPGGAGEIADLPDGGVSIGHGIPVAECLRDGASSLRGHDRHSGKTDNGPFQTGWGRGRCGANGRRHRGGGRALCQYGRQAHCSGAFVVLNTSLVSADSSFSGLYVQRSNAAHTTSGLLLYRGMADIGRRHDVMPHRKWAQEFDLSEFPGFAEHLKTASVPIERDCRTTSLLTLLDTSERAILLTVPMLGGDGTVYGLCGFAVNQTYFSSHHVQPSGINRLACILSDSAEGLDVSKGLLTYPADGFCFVPDELLTKKISGRDSRLSPEQSFPSWAFLSPSWPPAAISSLMP